MMDYIDYLPGHDYGTGIYTLDGSVRGDAIIESELDTVEQAEGATTTFEAQRVESTEQLQKMLSAATSLNGGYGLVRGGASFSNTSSTAIDSYSLFLLVRVSVFNPFKQLRNVKINQAARELWETGDSELWVQRYGDSFCRGMVTGGAFFALVNIATRDDEHMREIDAKLKAGYGAFGQGVDFKASIHHSLKEVSRETSMTISAEQIGGEEINLESADVDDLFDKALHFPKTVIGRHSVPFVSMCMPYETVSNLPPTPNKVDLQHAMDTMDACASLRQDYIDGINDINYVLGNSEQFEWKNRKAQMRKLEGLADELSEAINRLARNASRCANNVQECELPGGDVTVDFSIDAELPDRKRGKKKRKKKEFPYWNRTPVKRHICFNVKLKPKYSNQSAPRFKWLVFGHVKNTELNEETLKKAKRRRGVVVKAFDGNKIRSLGGSAPRRTNPS